MTQTQIQMESGIQEDIVDEMPWSSSIADVRLICRAQPIVIDGFRVDLIDSLRDAAIARHETRRSTPTLNVGGWRSDDLASWGEPCATDLVDAIYGRVAFSEIVTWAMVNRLGSHHPRHRHDSAVVSGIYYLDPGEDPSSPTVFELGARGRAGTKPKRGAPEVAIDAIAGRLVLFPSDMWHGTRPYAGERPRITVTFDVRR